METTRRLFLGGLTAISVGQVPGVAIGELYPSPGVPQNQHPIEIENPDLLEAYEGLRSACNNYNEAKEALAWLRDEWRHLWPLAPEELLNNANADKFGNRDAAERDIIGEFIIRDTSTLIKRFSKRQRANTPKTCFTVVTAVEAQKGIDLWTDRALTGRSEEALRRSQDLRDRMLGEYRRKLELAREYEKQTTRLRHTAGVETYNERLAKAERAIRDARANVSRTPAFTTLGLQIKAEALRLYDIFNHISEGEQGFFGELDRFTQSVISVNQGASA